MGDVHGYHQNLRKLLVQEKVINKKGAPINRDEFRVYCTGDLIDGGYNRQGDILNLRFAASWFDGICLGNHEMAFLGVSSFNGRRKYDRETLKLLLELLDLGIYTPSLVVDDYLLVHAGFAPEWGFDNTQDAHAYIQGMWELQAETDFEIPIFDWKSPYRNAWSKDPTGSIFDLDWNDDRNWKIPQIVGHSSYYNGPIQKQYDNGIVHWNIDTGGKSGKGLGGVIIDETGEIEIVYWGERYDYGVSRKYASNGNGETVAVDIKTKTTVSPYGKNFTIIKPEKKQGSLSLDDMDRVDIHIIEDPAVLEAYKEELKSSGLRLSEFFPEGYSTIH